MIWAINNTNEKEEATPKQIAKCPICEEEVVSKCGKIKVWHWAHKNKSDCDNWYEPESQWHKDWKNKYPKELQEFTMGCHRADIRTNNRWIIELQNSTISQQDIIDREIYYNRMIWLINGGTLCKGLRLRDKNDKITFRWKNPPKSWWDSKKEIYIDLSEIISKMRVLLNGYEHEDKKHTCTCYEYETYEYYTEHGEHVVADKEYPTAYKMDDTEHEIEVLKKKINLFNNKLFLIKNIYKKIPCGGWGELISKEDFINKFK